MIQKARKRFYYPFVTLIIIICAIVSLVSIPFLEGTNTGQDMCVYTTEENANWHFMGEPCRLTGDAISVFIFGYLTSFLFLFVILGGISLIGGKYLFQLQTCFKRKINNVKSKCYKARDD